jgi:hypothetical protein
VRGGRLDEQRAVDVEVLNGRRERVGSEDEAVRGVDVMQHEIP